MLFDEARTSEQLKKELDDIMQFCNGPDNTLTALHSFLSHRSDWWAYTRHSKNPVAYANAQLTQLLQIDHNSGEPIQHFLKRRHQNCN